MDKNLTKGMTLMIVSNVAFCGMVWLIRYAHSVNSNTTALFRFVVGMAVIGGLAMTGRVRLSFVDKRGLFVRGLLGGVSVWMCFLSIVKLGLVKSSLIGYSFPMFAAVFSSALLKERFCLAKAAGVAGAFCGMALVGLSTARGGVSFGIGFWEIFALVGAMLSGLTIVLIKKLQDTDSTEAIFFAQCLVGFWLMVVPATASPLHCGMTGCVVLISIGLLAAIGQLGMTEGFRYVSVASGSVVTLCTPLLNIAAGALLFREPFSAFTIAGAAVLLGSSALVVYGDMRINAGGAVERGSK
jgi:drug/metabolite transporter (DMT)-like permease